MTTLGFLYHEDYLKHDTGTVHPEKPDRLRAIVQHLESTPLWNDVCHLRPQQADVKWIETVHPASHIEMIREQCALGSEYLDEGDTRVCRASYDVALLAAGGVLLAVDRVLSSGADSLDSVFCALRPPGHHAETIRVMGFCLFNNVAIGARYAQRVYGVDRIAIVDWDVHHGNGTQEIFYSDPSVLYISLHQYPWYPGTGAASEIGQGKGEGFTLNCPMRAGAGALEYMEAFENKIVPALHTFQPQLIFISAGFDAHRDDPLANINLGTDSFAIFTQYLREVADKFSNGKIISVLEGGYHLRALAESVDAHLHALGE